MAGNLTLDEIGRLLAGDEAATSGALPPVATEPVVNVEGVGDLSFPLSAPRLKKLLAHGQPAPFGKGEQTLTDTSVRHTWHFPDRAVQVDWGGQLQNVLESARSVLGLPPSTQLRAEFHSLLVYERGQFFAAHQDSQKDDAMVATLVIMPPSRCTGGELVVHDGAAKVSHQGSAEHTAMVAFYADQVHEVLPVRTGHRVSLTFNLLLAGDSRAQDVAEDDATALSTLLTRYFTTSQSRYGRDLGTPTRMAYLLDREYTPRWLNPDRLKGTDAVAAAALVAAAEHADCEVVLALTDVHETRDASYSYDDGLDWYDDDDGGYESGYDDGPAGDPGELIDAEVTVTHWMTPAGAVAQVDLGLGDEEVATSTPTESLLPYASEHEGYMGNYGNTVDRWYKRAALLVWPRRLAFTNRAEAAPATELRAALVRLADGDEAGVLDDLSGMTAAWPGWVHRAQYGAAMGSASDPAELLRLTLAVARYAGDAELADELLAPFQIEDLRPDAVEDVIALAQWRGGRWARDLLGQWFSGRTQVGIPRARALPLLPEVCLAFEGHEELSRVVVDRAWAQLRAELTPYLPASLTSRTHSALAGLAGPLAAVLRSSIIAGADDSRAEIMDFCRQDELLPAVLPMLDLTLHWDDHERQVGLPELADHAVRLLREYLDAPVRDADDWSITPPPGCECDLCTTLGEFLADRETRRLQWPIAKRKRQHIHQVIDGAELPVSHTTRRSGSPYTLVLTKTAELFDREARAREDAQAELAGLQDQWG